MHTGTTAIDAAARSRLLVVESYSVFLDLTDGGDTARSRTEIRFRCREQGVTTFADLDAAERADGEGAHFRDRQALRYVVPSRQHGAVQYGAERECRAIGCTELWCDLDLALGQEPEPACAIVAMAALESTGREVRIPADLELELAGRVLRVPRQWG